MKYPQHYIFYSNNQSVNPVNTNQNKKYEFINWDKYNYGNNNANNNLLKVPKNNEKEYNVPLNNNKNKSKSQYKYGPSTNNNNNNNFNYQNYQFNKYHY